MSSNNPLKPQEQIMYTGVALPPLILTSVDYHIAAAESHEEAAEAHRLAAAAYMYGDFQQANEKARLARQYGTQASEQCALAME